MSEFQDKIMRTFLGKRWVPEIRLVQSSRLLHLIGCQRVFGAESAGNEDPRKCTAFAKRKTIS